LEANIRSIRDYVNENKMDINVDFDKVVDEWFEGVRLNYETIKHKMNNLRELDNFKGAIELQEEVLKVMQVTYRLDEIVRELVGLMSINQMGEIVHLNSVMINLNEYHEQAVLYWETQYEEAELRNNG